MVGTKHSRSTRAPIRRGIILDGNGHLLGRLASVVAKQLLRGERVTVLRCEGINISGTFQRNKNKFLRYLNKRVLSNPKRGPYHFRAPSMIFARTVRGMIPYQTKRGAWAMRRLSTFDGKPKPYDKKKAYVCPRAMRRMRLRPSGAYCYLGRLSAEMGWQHADIVKKLETKRKELGKTYWEEKQKKMALHEDAIKQVNAALVEKIGQVRADTLAKYGYVQ